jgi:hypothetical protein
MTAIATVVLGVFAIVTAWYARRAFLKQSKDVSDQAAMLDLQRRQLEQDQLERRRAQAARVFIMIEGSEDRQGQVTLMATACNTSSQPVFDLWVRWRTAHGEFGTPSVAPQFLPGATRPFEVIWTEAAGMSETGVSLDFRDAAGVHWRTTDRGILTELCGAAGPHRGLNRCTFAPRHDGPHSWAETAANLPAWSSRA